MIDIVQRGLVPMAGQARRVDPELTRPSHVRVRAATNALKRRMKHGITRVGFLPDINQSVEWPFDQFTKRRLLTGSITIDEDVPGGKEAAAMFPKREFKPERPEPKAEARAELKPKSK
jgi:hypothetical protein